MCDLHLFHRFSRSTITHITSFVPCPFKKANVHTIFTQMLRVRVSVKPLQSSCAKMQAVWVKVKQGGLYWLVYVHSCLVQRGDSHIADPQLDGLVCAELSLIKKCLIAAQQVLGNRRRWPILGQQKFVWERREMTVRKMRSVLWQRALSVRGYAAVFCLFVFCCKMGVCQVFFRMAYSRNCLSLQNTYFLLPSKLFL